MTPWTAACQASLSFTTSWSFLKPMSIESVMSSSYLVLRHLLLLLPSIFPRASALCIRWPKYWSFSFSISLSNEYSGLIWLFWYPYCPRDSSNGQKTSLPFFNHFWFSWNSLVDLFSPQFFDLKKLFPPSARSSTLSLGSVATVTALEKLTWVHANPPVAGFRQAPSDC